MKLSPSQIIKSQCCSSMLDVPKCELVQMVENLETQNQDLLACVRIYREELWQKYKSMVPLAARRMLSISERDYMASLHTKIAVLDDLIGKCK